MSAVSFDVRDDDLLARTIAAREAISDEDIFHPCCCGPCADCAEFAVDFANQSKHEAPENDFVAASRSIIFTGAKRPKYDAFISHAKHYGAEGIMEIAEMVLSKTATARLYVTLVREGLLKSTVRARKTPIKEQVLGLQSRGLSVDEIAEALDISVKRAREVIGAASRTKTQ